MMMPVSGTMIMLPKKRLMVVVKDNASPERSAVDTCEVPGLYQLALQIPIMNRRYVRI